MMNKKGVGLRPLIGGFAIIILFSFCMFQFMTQYLLANNPDSTILTAPGVNQSIQNLNNSITSLKDTTSGAQELLAKDQPSATDYVFLIFKSAFSVPINFLAFLIASVGTFQTIIFTSLIGPGSAPMYLVFAVIDAILVVGIIFSIIQFVRTGQAER